MKETEAEAEINQLEIHIRELYKMQKAILHLEGLESGAPSENLPFNFMTFQNARDKIIHALRTGCERLEEDIENRKNKITKS